MKRFKMQSMRRALLAASALLVLSACGGGDSPEPLPFQRVETNGGSYAAGNYVFRTRAEMQAAWNAAPQQLFGQPVEQKPMPEIDFTQNTVVGVSMGQDIVCHVLRIREVVRHGDTVQVNYWSNKEYGGTTLACVRPSYLADFVVIPATPGPVTFSRVPE